MRRKQARSKAETLEIAYTIIDYQTAVIKQLKAQISQMQLAIDHLSGVNQ